MIFRFHKLLKQVAQGRNVFGLPNSCWCHLTRTTQKASENHVMPETLFKCRVSFRGSNIYMLVLTNTTTLPSRVQCSTADMTYTFMNCVRTQVSLQILTFPLHLFLRKRSLKDQKKAQCPRTNGGLYAPLSKTNSKKP